jgi:hypothetical protein
VRTDCNGLRVILAPRSPRTRARSYSSGTVTLCARLRARRLRRRLSTPAARRLAQRAPQTPHGALADARRVRRARRLADSQTRRLAPVSRQQGDSIAPVTRQRVRGTAGRYQRGVGGSGKNPGLSAAGNLLVTPTPPFRLVQDKTSVQGNQ